jgi:hypothetical protein
MPIDECYPFEADATLEMADLLKRRIQVMENSIIENIKDIALPSTLLDLK